MCNLLTAYQGFEESALIANTTHPTLLTAHLNVDKFTKCKRLTSLIILAKQCLSGVGSFFAFVKNSESYPSSLAYIDTSNQLHLLSYGKEAGKGGFKKVNLYHDLCNGQIVVLITQRKHTPFQDIQHEFYILSLVAKLKSPYIASEILSELVMIPAKNSRSDTSPFQKGAFLMRGYASNACGVPRSPWPAESLKCVHDVAHAVFCLHLSGLIHGDLRAENVLRSNEGFKLADFGSACFKGAAIKYSGEGELPPEVRANELIEIKESFDYWGLGLLAITFAYPSEPHWVLRHQFSKIREQSQMDQAIQELREIILKSWSEPSDSGRICRLKILSFASNLLKIDPAKRMLVLPLLHNLGSSPPLLDVSINPT